jgi:hypothetical protein
MILYFKNTCLGKNKNIVMGPKTKNDCAGEGQQQISKLLCPDYGCQARKYQGESLLLEAVIKQSICGHIEDYEDFKRIVINYRLGRVVKSL